MFACLSLFTASIMCSLQQAVSIRSLSLDTAPATLLSCAFHPFITCVHVRACVCACVCVRSHVYTRACTQTPRVRSLLGLIMSRYFNWGRICKAFDTGVNNCPSPSLLLVRFLHCSCSFPCAGFQCSHPLPFPAHPFLGKVHTELWGPGLAGSGGESPKSKAAESGTCERAGGCARPVAWYKRGQPWSPGTGAA